MDDASLQNFLRKNKHAWQFAHKAIEDYLLVRLGLHSALWSSFEMATQAVEKLLKSYLLFSDPSLQGEAAEVRQAVAQEAKKRGRRTERGHDVEAAFNLAKLVGLPADPIMEARLSRLNDHYASRYPDGNGPSSKGTNELNDIDQVVFGLWDAFLRFNDDYIYVCGIASPIYAFHMYRLQGIANEFAQSRYAILTLNNIAFYDRERRFSSEVLRRLHPKISRKLP